MYRLGDIAQLIGARLQGGEANCQIKAIKPLKDAAVGELSFLSNPKYRKFLLKTQASAVIVPADFAASCPTAALVVEDPYLAYAQAAQLFAEKKTIKAGIHPTAVIGENCQIHPSAVIGAYVVVGDEVTIGQDCCIAPHTVIRDRCYLESHVTLHPHVTLYSAVRIGPRVIIHSGAVLGADGFGFANTNGHWLKIPQLGTVVIHEDVEIGANTTIDRGALGDTIIGKGVKLDNHIQIGHNVVIGDHTIIAACSGVSGSVEIGKYCRISGMVGFTGHFKVADHVIITANTIVSKGIKKPGIYSSGILMDTHADWKRNAARFRQLDDMAKRIKQLEQLISSM